MPHPSRETLGALRTSPGFAAAVLLTLAAAGFNGFMVLLMMLEVDLPGPFGRMTHFQEPHHRVHDLTFGFLFVPVVVGLLAQIRRPTRNVTGMLMALVPATALLVTLLLTLVLAGDARVLQPPWVMVGAAALIATGLHPAGHDFFRSFRSSRIGRVMLGLVIVAAVPLLVFAGDNIGLQRAVADDHAAAGHYGFMAAFGLTVVGVGALASLRADGWRLAAWVTGLLPILLGLASLTYPQATSSLELLWSLLSIAWGVAFVAAAELTEVPPGARPELRSDQQGARTEPPPPDAG